MMAIDEHDKQTQALPLQQKRGPKPKFGKPMTAAERMRRVREKRRAKGMRQVWLTREQLDYLQQLQVFKESGEPIVGEWVNRFLAVMGDLEL